MSERQSKSDWDDFYALAAGQVGWFTSKQAKSFGYSQPWIQHHLKSGNFERKRRGIYRLSNFPFGEHEELIEIWLWSGQEGVFSHQTALYLHTLSDVLPQRIYLTLPKNWKQKRIKIPDGVSLHYRDVPSFDRTWNGPVPLTTVRRTLTDCFEAEISQDLIKQATKEAKARGLI